MDECFNPQVTDDTTVSIYSFLRCLRKYQDGPSLLPPNGITFIEAKQIANFVFKWFQSYDMREGLASSAFDQSILGTRLQAWENLLNHPSTIALWMENPKGLTFWWFHSCRAFLQPFQALVAGNRWRPGFGFIQSKEITVNSDCDNHTTFTQHIAAADAQFGERWASSRLNHSRYFASALDDHFQCLPAAKAPDHPVRIKIEGEPRIPKKRTREADFRATKPLFQLVGPLPERQSGVPSRITKFFQDPGAKMFRLLDEDGKWRLICLKSSAQPPFHTCCTPACDASCSGPRNNRTRGRLPYFHVDLGLPYFQNVPEAYFVDIVAFLQLPGVSDVVRPSAALKQLTPSTNW